MLPEPHIPPPLPAWKRALSVLIRWLISTLAIFVAVLIVPGIEFTGPGWQLGIVAVVFGLINVLLRPILSILTCPLILLTFGLFGLVINAGLLLLTSAISQHLGVLFHINGFWPAVWGGLIIAIISAVLNLLAGETNVVLVRPTRREP